MNYTITYLDDSTIVIFDHGRVVIIDENLEGWKVRKAQWGFRLDFSRKTRSCRVFPRAIFWHQDGELHRDGAPAVIYADGANEWLHHGKRHRDDGPAIIYADGTKEWYRNDRPIPEPK